MSENRLTTFRRAVYDVLGPITMDCGVQVRTGETIFSEREPDHQAFAVIITVGVANEQNADKLDELLDASGPRSIKAALEADRQLGGALDVAVVKTSGVRPYPGDNNVPELGAEWTINARLGG